MKIVEFALGTSSALLAGNEQLKFKLFMRAP